MEPPIMNIEEQEKACEVENHIGNRVGKEGKLHMYNFKIIPIFNQY